MICFYITTIVHHLEKCCYFPPLVGWPWGFCCRQGRGLGWTPSPWLPSLLPLFALAWSLLSPQQQKPVWPLWKAAQQKTIPLFHFYMRLVCYQSTEPNQPPEGVSMDPDGRQKAGTAPLVKEREEKRQEQGGTGLHHSEQHTVNATNGIVLIEENEWSKMWASFSNGAWYFHVLWRAATMVQMQRGCQGNRHVLLQMCSEAHSPDIHIASLPWHLNSSLSLITNFTLITLLQYIGVLSWFSRSESKKTEPPAQSHQHSVVRPLKSKQ